MVSSISRTLSRPFLALLVVLMTFSLSVAIPNLSVPAIGKETSPTTAPTAYSSNSTLLQISAGETSSSGWNYQYDPTGHPDTFIRSVYSERYGVASTNWGSVQQSSSFTVDTAFGSQAAPDTATLHYGNLKLTRQVIPPVGSARQFAIKYVLTNTSQNTSLQNVRFFQGIDYDISDSSNDYGWYASGTDIVWQNDDSYFRNGFGGSRQSSHHDCNNYSSMWNDMWAGTLNDANKYPATGTADVGVGLQWDSGDLAAGASWDLTITFYFGEAAGIQANAGADQSFSRAAPVTFNGSRSESVDAIIKYEWDANNDGIYEINAGTAPTYNFAGWNDLAQHTVRLRITDNSSRMAEDSVIYTLVPNVDLMITSFTFSPSANIKDGDSVAFNTTLKNQGLDALTGSFYVRLNVDNNFVARSLVSGLSAGNSTTNNFSWTATSGNHTAKVIADEYAAVVETSKTNNEALANLPTILSPDLAVSSLKWLPTSGIEDGNDVLLTANVTNFGPGATSRGFLVGFKIDGTTFGSQLVPSGLPANGSMQVYQHWTAQAGSYIVSAKADDTNLVIESNETNNTLTPAANLPNIPLPDLQITALTWQPPANIIDGMTVTLAAMAANSGPGNTHQDIVVSFEIDGVSIGTQSVAGGLPAGSTAQVIQTWKARSGNHTASATADSDNKVLESNETNNTYTPSPNLPSIPQPDLQITQLTFTPATGIGHGQTVNFTAQVSNTGMGATAADFYVNFQIDGAYVGYRTIQGGLMAGTSSSVSFPWTAIQGTHTVKAIADPATVVTESNESNNEMQVSLPNIPTPPLANVTSPKGSEIWNGNHNITWTAASPDSLALSITIDLYNGYTYKTIASGLANSGTYVWDSTKYADGSAVSDGTNYKVRVTATDTRSVKGSDLSDNFMTVWNTAQVEVAYPNNLKTTEMVNATYIVTIVNRQPRSDTYNLSVIDTDNAALAQLSQASITLGAWASVTVSLNVTDETPGFYNVSVKAQSQSQPGVSALRQIQTQVITSFGIGLEPATGNTSIGGSFGYTLVVTNNRGVSDTFNLNLSGLSTSWYNLTSNVTLNAGETRRVPFNVNVPDSAAAGIINFQAHAVSSGLAAGKQADGVLSVSGAPLISNLQPPTNIHTGATDLLITWQTTATASSQVFFKLQSATIYTQVTGTAGTNHSVSLSGLSRAAAYDFYVHSEGTHGAVESEVRHFNVDNGITFGQRSYSFTIERDYGQAVNISVSNTDSQPHNLSLSVKNVPADLQVNFIGEGSQDQTVPLHAGESKSITLMIFAPDALSLDYSLVLWLISQDAQAISDSAALNIHIHIPNVNFALAQTSADPTTLARTLSITNNGDPLTDLGISMSPQLANFLTFNPSINHQYLGTGQSLTFQAVPILSYDYTGASGNVTARAAGQIRTLLLDFSMPPGKQIYQGHTPNMSLIYDPQFDNDNLVNTNPDNAVINSYMFTTDNGTGKAYMAQITMKALSDNVPASKAEVLLQVTGSGAPATYTGVTDIWGRCIFTIVGPPGQYSYFGKLKGYPASTPVRNFTVALNSTLTMKPMSISWLSVADATQTQTISGNQTADVTLGAPPFTIKAMAADIPQVAIPVLFLINDVGYSAGEIVGEVQGNNLVFRIGSEIDPGHYRATVGLQAQGLIATSGSRNLIFSDTAAAPAEEWNFNYKMPFPIDATSVGVVDIQNKITAANPHKLVRMVWLEPQDDTKSTYVFTYMIVADQTMDDTLIVKVTGNNSEVLYQTTQPIHLVEYEATFVDVPVPVRDISGQRLGEFNIQVTTLDYFEFVNSVKTWVTDTGVFDGETWSIFWQNGVLTPQNRAGVIFKCLGGFLPGLGTVITAIDTVNQATTGDWVAAGGGVGQLVTDPLESLGTQNYMSAANHVWNQIKNQSPEMADAILKNTKGNMQKLIKEASRVKNLASIARWAGYAAGVKSNYDDWQRVTEEVDPNNSKAQVTQNTNDWYCTNKPVIGVDFNLPSSIPQYVVASPPTPNAEVANLTIRFSPGFTSGSYKDVLPHDVHVLLNGTEIGTLTNVVPNGHYTFQFDPALLHYAQQGTAKNTITVATQHMNSGHYVVSSDFSIELQVKRVDMTVVASNQTEADQIVMQLAGTLTPKADFGVFPENFSLSDSQPSAGQQVRIETTVYNLGGVDQSGIPIQFTDNTTQIESWEIPFIPAYGSAKVATWWTPTLGNHAITARINSDHSITESSYSNNEASMTVQAAPPDTTPPSITNPQPANQSSTSATMPLITADLADAASGINPATVSISIDSANVTAAATITPTRVSYIPAAPLSLGTHQFTVQASDMKGNQASMTFQFTVKTATKAATTTNLISSANPSASGQSLTFAATVNGGSGITGNVDFKDGDTFLATATLNGTAQAAYSTSALSEGNHSITANYTGDANFLGSASSVLGQTIQIINGGNVNISTVLQGGSRPAAGWVVLLNVKFFSPGADVMTSPPTYTFNLMTSKNGTTAITQIPVISPGTYDITAVTQSCLINVKRNVVIVSPTTDVNMGTLLEGNANDNNIINILDFGILAAAYGKSSGSGGYDARADFDRNGIINIFDFGLLAANYSKFSPITVP